VKALLVALMLAVSGCAITGTGALPVSQQLSPVAQQVQTSINEANVLLNAMAQVIGANVQEKIYTREEGQQKLDQVRAYGREVDRAQALLDRGEVLAAKDKAELAMRLLTILQREVAAQARKQ
jgi:hypothetical protein